MSTSSSARPDAAEYASYYGKYVSLVPAGEILSTLERQREQFRSLLDGLPDKEANTRHPPYTWSIKEVVGHLTDSERVFGYRALCIARGDQTPLPGFDENEYARAASFDRYPLGDLLAEFDALRRSHILLFRGLSAEAWQRRGTANQNPVSVRALAYIIAGHVEHHAAIVRRRLGRA